MGARQAAGRLSWLLSWGGCCAPTELSGYGFVEKIMTCIVPLSLVGTITRRVFGS